MSINMRERAASLIVRSMYTNNPPNGDPRGRSTPPQLYDPSFGHIWEWMYLMGYVIHGTVGADTLEYWLSGGSMRPGGDGIIPWSMAHYLALRDRNTVCKMAPDPTPTKRYNTNHVGESNWHHPDLRDKKLGQYLKGIECEDLQNWNRGSRAQQITDDQVIKCALMIAYDFALDHQVNGANAKSSDLFILGHSQIALPWGRRSDPEAGNFNWDLFDHCLTEIRKPEVWPTNWPARYVGLSPSAYL